MKLSIKPHTRVDHPRHQSLIFQELPQKICPIEKIKEDRNTNPVHSNLKMKPNTKHNIRANHLPLLGLLLLDRQQLSKQAKTPFETIAPNTSPTKLSLGIKRRTAQNFRQSLCPKAHPKDYIQECIEKKMKKRKFLSLRQQPIAMTILPIKSQSGKAEIRILSQIGKKIITDLNFKAKASIIKYT